MDESLATSPIWPPEIITTGTSNKDGGIYIYSNVKDFKNFKITLVSLKHYYIFF